MSIISAGTSNTTTLVYTGDTTGNLVFQSNGTTEAMRITTAQNVGIGTSSPAARLDVRSGTSPSAANILIGLSGSNNYYDANTHIWQNGSSVERMRIDSSGNVGINASTIAALGTNITTLQISGRGINDTGGVRIRSSDNSVDGYFYGSNAGIALGSITSHPAIFYTANSERMRIDSSGNVLVGGTSQSGTANRVAVFSGNKFGLSIIDTTAQAAGVGGALNLGGNYRTAGDAQAFTRIAAAKENSTDNNFAYAMAFSTTPNGGTFTEAMRIDSSGNVGIGTGTSTINTTLAVNGNALIGTGAWPINDFGRSGSRVVMASSTEDGILAVVNMQTGVGASRGGQLYLGARATTGVDGAAFSIIAGIRENSTSGNYSSALTFSTMPSNGVTAERMRLTSNGELFVFGQTNNGYIASQKLISVANGSTLSINAGFGAHIYVSLGDGSSAVFWSPWASGTTLLNSAGQAFSATDAGTATRVFKSGSTANVTLRNSTGGTNNYYILIVTGY